MKFKLIYFFLFLILLDFFVECAAAKKKAKKSKVKKSKKSSKKPAKAKKHAKKKTKAKSKPKGPALASQLPPGAYASVPGPITVGDFPPEFNETDAYPTPPPGYLFPDYVDCDEDSV